MNLGPSLECGITPSMIACRNSEVWMILTLRGCRGQIAAASVQQAKESAITISSSYLRKPTLLRWVERASVGYDVTDGQQEYLVTDCHQCRQRHSLRMAIFHPNVGTG